MPKNWFDDDVAARYDEVMTPLPESGVDLLAQLAGQNGCALEFAIGTGRVALPLAARGITVAGIELSAAMVAQLRAKAGGDETSIEVALGDMTTARVAGQFDLVFLVFNTIMNLTSQDAQVACFANAARHLRRNGAFVIETGVPALRKLPPGERYVTFALTSEHVGVDEYEVVGQGLVSHHVTTDADGRVRRSSTPFRYVWPSELDLMARLAGLRLRDRFAGWDRTPFTETSESHVSVWIKDERA